MKLLRPLYGLGIAGNLWYQRLTEFMKRSGFTTVGTQLTLLQATDESANWPNSRSDDDSQFIILACIYVDDLLFAFSSERAYRTFHDHLAGEFDISTSSELEWYLGTRFSYNLDGIFLDQEKYIDDLLEVHGFSEANSSPTPFQTGETYDDDVPDSPL
eukprot:759248-Hanusia_phi.AAC.1